MAAAPASDQPIAAGMVRVLCRASSPSVAALSNPENWPNAAVTPSASTDSETPCGLNGAAVMPW
jgi:hypothetical protein